MTYLIVDGNSLYARSYFAAEHMGASPLEAVSLVVQSFLLLVHPEMDRIGVRFDGTLFAWDSVQNPLKNRKPKPQVYHDAMDATKSVLTELFNVRHAEHPEFEADDVVATAVRNAAKEDILYVASADKDLQQLQSKRVRYYCLNTKAELSRNFITSKWHVKRPSQVALALAIIGDPVDSIKGIKGYGPVACKKLFAAITPEMKLGEACEAIIKQLPEDKAAEFNAALDRTILKTDVPGVKAPSALRLAEPQLIRQMKLARVYELYDQVFDAYAR